MVTVGQFRTVSEIKRDNCKIFPPMCQGFLLKFCNGAVAQETRTMSIPDGPQKYDDMSICLDTVPALDRHTDRRTDLL